MIVKSYVCDICGRTIDNPYKAHMREYFICPYEEKTTSYFDARVFKRVHICGDCHKIIAEHVNGA